VGHDLARDLAAAGARVLVADVDEEHAAHVAAEIGAEVIPAGQVLTTECDVYAPCAIGGTLSAETIPTLGCRIVAGSANNQLVEPEDAARLHARAILYAPDYAINAGGVLQLLGLEALGWDEAELELHLAGIGDTLRRLYRDADANGITPAEAAERLAAERVAAAQLPL
jgi:leucine dehydrogenase